MCTCHLRLICAACGERRCEDIEHACTAEAIAEPDDKTDEFWEENGGLTNSDRAAKAEIGVREYYETGWALCVEHRQQALGDALANMMHYAREHRLDWDKALQGGVMHFDAEVEGTI